MKKEDLQKLLKETSPQDLWEGLKKIEESLEGVEGTVENLEQLIVDMISEEASEDESKYLPESEVQSVAKTKGLPSAEGGLIKKYMGAHLGSPREVPDSAVTKGAKGKKELADYHPTSEELAKINQLSNVDMKAEEVLVFNLHSADEIVDRSADQFTGKALKEMAALSVNKPYLKDHSWSTDSVIGKIFDASVSKGRLMQKVYVPITAKTNDIATGMLTGTHDKVSVGFAMGAENYVCSSCTKSLYSMDCPHYPGSKDEKGNVTIGIIKGVKDYYEISNVVVPCQPAAGIRRNNQKGLENEPIDRILNENLSTNGDDPVPNDPKSTEEVTAPENAPEVIAPEGDAPAAGDADVSKEASAPEAPIEKAVDVEAVVKAAVASALDELKELIAELKSTLAAKVEVEKSAEEESTEEVARKLLASTPVVEKSEDTPSVDLQKSGWMFDLGKALQSRDSQ